MRNPFRRKALSGSPGVVDAIQQGNAFYPMLGSESRQRILNVFNTAQSASYAWMYSNSPAVRSVIDVIVRNIGQLELRCYEEISEAERRPAPDHPAARSLRYPSELNPADNLIRSLFKDYLIYDQAYSLLTPKSDGTLLIERIPAYMVEGMGSSLFVMDLYRVWPQGVWASTGMWGGAGRYVDFTPDQIMHWHGENPLDPRIGVSKLDTLRDVVAEDAALAQAVIELAKNGLQEPIWISRPLEAPAIGADILKLREEDLANRLRSRNRKPLMMTEGERLESFGISPQDAQMMEVRRWAMIRVAAEYGVPLGMLGLDPNVEQAQTSFYADTLPPIAENFCRTLEQRICVRSFDWQAGRFAFNLNEKLMGDDRLRALVSASGRPVMLTNEARAQLNLPPIDGGDELVTPLNVLVGDNPKPSPAVMGPQDPNLPAQDGSFRTDQGPTPVPSANNGKMIDHKAVEPLPRFHPRQTADLARQARNISVFQGIVDHHLGRLSRSLKSKPTTDWERWDREFAQNLHGELARAVQAEGDVYALKLASAENFDMGQVAHYLQAMAEGAATAINDTVRKEIDAQGLDGAMARTSQHVESAGRSLGVRATVFAREEAARQAPGFQGRVKTWIADSARHAQFDGQTVPISADWPGGFAPGGEPGCACTLSVT